MITSLSTQGGRINPQTMGVSGTSLIVAFWSLGSAAAPTFNPYWAANSNMYIGPIAPQPETH